MALCVHHPHQTLSEAPLRERFFWDNHDRDTAGNDHRYDYRLVWLNLFMLMAICFLPFPTAVQGSYGNQPLSVVFYAISVAVVGILSMLVWLYASANHRLIDRSLSSQFIRLHTVQSPIAPVVFLASIALVAINADLARYSWLILIPISIFLGMKRNEADSVRVHGVR